MYKNWYLDIYIELGNDCWGFEMDQIRSSEVCFDIFGYYYLIISYFEGEKEFEFGNIYDTGFDIYLNFLAIHSFKDSIIIHI